MTNKTSDKNDKAEDTASTETDETSLNTRRNALRTLTAGTIVAGAAAPERWRKPVVQSIVLPAHAQSSVRAPAPSSDCTIILAEILQNGNLFVVGEWPVPANCINADGDSRGASCQLISDGTTLAQENRSTAGGDCSDAPAPTLGCLLSCSVAVDQASHSVNPGDDITMRFEFEGGCVCSAVGTVTGFNN